MTTHELRTEVDEVAELVLDQCRCSTDPDFTTLVTVLETTDELGYTGFVLHTIDGGKFQVKISRVE